MSSFVEKLNIKRNCKDDAWLLLSIRYYLNEMWHLSTKLNCSNQNEDEELSSLVDDFVIKTGSQKLRDDIVEGFRQLRKNNQDSTELKICLPTHTSCRKNNKENFRVLAGNEVSQYDLKGKLTSLDKNAIALKFFEKNNCLVCLSNYKENLDEDLHIVVPNFGHPLCCKCADEVSESGKCPQCRGNIETYSFELLRINSDLEVVLENQRIFFKD